MRSIGAELKHIRESNKLRMKDVAKGVGCSTSHIGALEVGRNAFPLNWVGILVGFWRSKGVELNETELLAKAYLHNGHVPLEHLPEEIRMKYAMEVASANTRG